MEKLERLEKYVMVPDVGFYGGFVYEGQDMELCDDHDKEGDYECHIKQRIEQDVLYTELTRSYERKGKKRVVEVSHMEVEIEKGELIVYVEGLGFTIPEHKMCKVNEAIELYELLEGTKHDTGTNEEKGTGIN